MPFVTFKVQYKDGMVEDKEELRRMTEQDARTLSEKGSVYVVTVKDEPDLEARDGEVE